MSKSVSDYLVEMLVETSILDILLTK